MSFKYEFAPLETEIIAQATYRKSARKKMNFDMSLDFCILSWALSTEVLRKMLRLKQTI